MDWIQYMLKVGYIGILLHQPKEDMLEAYAMVETDWREVQEIFKM